MSNTRLSAVTAMLLAAACVTALADPPRKHTGNNTVSETTSQPSSAYSAPVGNYDKANEYVQPVGRSGSHSMHPGAPVAAEQFADDQVEASRTIDDDYPNAPGSN
ncbi:hypothetical protein [Pseudomonas sp. CFII64]|jgi:hypothetical protein|uniref:hypothetical protein n=1 Tax=Pseudomonas sp. CFII64 TaxID=911242 RepID=UPI0012EBE4A6|nr:hypothetical protein [Pseudomonas sp. CFII64]